MVKVITTIWPQFVVHLMFFLAFLFWGTYMKMERNVRGMQLTVKCDTWPNWFAVQLNCIAPICAIEDLRMFSRKSYRWAVAGRWYNAIFLWFFSVFCRIYNTYISFVKCREQTPTNSMVTDTITLLDYCSPQETDDEAKSANLGHCCFEVLKSEELEFCVYSFSFSCLWTLVQTKGGFLKCPVDLANRLVARYKLVWGWERVWRMLDVLLDQTV